MKTTAIEPIIYVEFTITCPHCNSEIHSESDREFWLESKIQDLPVDVKCIYCFEPFTIVKELKPRIIAEERFRSLI